MKKITLAAILAAAMGGMMSFIDNEDAQGEASSAALVASYNRQPPIAVEYWVRKLAEPINGNNMAMKIRYLDDGRPMDPELTVYNSGSTPVVFHDDGIAPDVTSHDHIYSAYLNEDLEAFTAQIQAMESVLIQKGSYTDFAGFVGREVTELPHFDMEAFSAGMEVPVHKGLINGVDCETQMKKQNSLFITDLSIVEDPARTYNIVERTGNPTGAWTFGKLVKNMANASSTGVSAKTFLREWVNSWMTDQTVTGYTVKARPHALRHLIRPWIRRAMNNPLLVVEDSNWVQQWNNTPEDSLLINAPFKLMAIVNRIDLRDNLAYSPTGGGGETRFIYTLIAPYSELTGTTNNPIAGKPVDGGGEGDKNGITAIDWIGMNVILEYHNPQTSLCDIRGFGQQWLDLSAYTLPLNPLATNNALNQALENITNTVTNANAAPSRPNGSAIARIRTNERVFFPSSSRVDASWSDSYWQLRQYEISSATHKPQMVPMALTPNQESSAITIYANVMDKPFGMPVIPYMDLDMADTLMNWAFVKKWSILTGNFGMPGKMLAPVADVTARQVHYFDLIWNGSGPNYNSSFVQSAPTDSLMREVRRQISVNTCQGCHTGETKTMFTQILPRGYHEPARYWTDVPDTIFMSEDDRFVENRGQTFITGDPSVSDNHKMGQTAKVRPVVSAFLTGRTYSGRGNFQDDLDETGKPQQPDDDKDFRITGLYYVNDPSNSYPNTSPGRDMRAGYNDLQRRFNDLCRLVNMDCGKGSSILQIISNTSFAGVPTHG